MSLRDKLIEAMKFTPGPFDSFDQQVEAQFDRLLDTLEANADEWHDEAFSLVGVWDYAGAQEYLAVLRGDEEDE